MNHPTFEDLQSLMAHTDKPCVSIWLPTTEVGPERRESARIRLKNAIDAAEEQLSSLMDRTQRSDLLAAAQAMLQQGGLWVQDAAGVVIYLTEGFSLIRKVDPPRDVQVVTAQRFVLRPILTHLGPEPHFLIMAISANAVRLLEATRYDVTDITPEDLPEGLQEALRIDEAESSLQLHSSRPTINAPGGHAAVFHGNNAPENDELDGRYMQIIMRMIDPTIKHRNLPLILAGVSRWFAHVRAASDYGRIWNDTIDGSPDRISDAELRDQAWQLFAPYHARQRAEAWQRYASALGSDSVGTAERLEAVVRAAMFGYVDTLLLPEGNPQWGRYDPERNELIRLDTPAESDGDLVDLAAAHTLINGGQVVLAPDSAALAGPVAILRFALPQDAEVW